MKIHLAEKIPTQGGSIRVIAKKNLIVFNGKESIEMKN